VLRVDRPSTAACIELGGHGGVRIDIVIDHEMESALVEVFDWTPAWEERFARAKAELLTVLPADATIEHVGSTIVPGLHLQNSAKSRLAPGRLHGGGQRAHRRPEVDRASVSVHGLSFCHSTGLGV
jgi:hypothetical protein